MIDTALINALLEKAEDLIAAIDGATDQFDREMEALAAAAMAVQNAIRPGLEALSPKQRRVVREICAMHEEGSSMSRPGPLAIRSGYKGSFDIGSCLDKLEHKGFIRRIRHGLRHVEIELTDAAVDHPGYAKWCEARSRRERDARER